MTTLLLLGAGPMQVPVIEACRARQVRVVAIDPSPDAPGLRLADEAHVHDLAAVDACLEAARRARVDGVLTFAADYPVPTAARLCAALGLPGPRLEAAARATNKRLMRQAFAEAGIPSPRSIPVLAYEQVPGALRRVAETADWAIVKPAISSGGKGITRVAVNADDAVHRRAFDHAMRATRGDGILVEQFVDGPEFSVECVTDDRDTHVVAITDKVTSGAPHYVEIGHSQPSRVADEAAALLAKTAIAAIRALGIDWSGSHAEIRLSPAGPRVIEIAARFGGGYIASHLVPLSCGVDLATAAVSLALGQRPSLAPTRRCGSAIRFLTPPAGVVGAVHGLDEARRLPGVRAVGVSVRPGDRVPELQDARGRAGFVICDAATADTAIARAERAAKAVDIETA